MAAATMGECKHERRIITMQLTRFTLHESNVTQKTRNKAFKRRQSGNHEKNAAEHNCETRFSKGMMYAGWYTKYFSFKMFLN